MAARAAAKPSTLVRLREILLALPGTSETASWGHPNFRTRQRIFAAFHADRSGVPCIWLRVEPLTWELLRDDPRILPASHGSGRWLGVRADRRVDWALVRELAREGHAGSLPKPRAR